jgi:outer membrane protein OmpA-like peptidoglycan-associated protein
MLFLGLLFSCTSVKKVELGSNNVTKELSVLEERTDGLEAKHANLFAQDDFEKAKEIQNELLSEKNLSKEKTLEKIARARGYLARVQEEVNSKKVVSAEILKARYFAQKNMTDNPESYEKLVETDDMLRDESSHFTKDLSPDTFSKIQKSYFNLEKIFLINKKLGYQEQIIKKSLEKGAEQKAPKSLNSAQKNYLSARNILSQNPRSPEKYMQVVKDSKTSSLLLENVMDKIVLADKPISEDAALRLIYANSEIKNLNNEYADAQNELKNKKFKNQLLRSQLNVTSNALVKTSNKLAIENKLNEIVKDFDKNEAEVYRQGNKVILRLRNIDFKLNSYKIPTESYAVLSKIASSVKDIKAQNITIQGHTDSTGSKSYNKELSLKRAKEVFEYMNTQDLDISLSYEGAGESEPISNNENLQGRQMNRRVDFIINTY